jgi:alpha-L-fucosidase
MKKYRLIFIYILLAPLLGGGLLFAQTPKPYGAVPTVDQLKWHNLEYYAFIHFGPNAFTDKEWGDGTEKEEIFNPAQLDCRQWARICKTAGMKGIIITAKHHDGFALYPSKYSTHTVRESKWKDGKGDILKELSVACKEFGLKMGIYISPWDRNHPAYGTPEYNQVYVNMLNEVTTQYGNLFEVWFDGANGEGPNGKKQVYDFPLFNKTVKANQPHALIFSDAGPDIRWVGNEKGFAGETNWNTINGKQLFPAYDKPEHLNMGDEHGTDWIPAECDVSIRPGWFYHKNEDEKVKTDKDLMNIWNKSVGRGSNLLLNLPVDSRGLIHENDEKALMNFKKMRNEYFTNNLLKNGTFTKNFSKDTYDITLKTPQTFNCLVIQEDIRYGQRVKKFYLQAKENGQWKNVGSATTIGHKRIMYFQKTTAKELRIMFDEAFAKPIILNVELYLTSE